MGSVFWIGEAGRLPRGDKEEFAKRRGKGGEVEGPDGGRGILGQGTHSQRHKSER